MTVFAALPLVMGAPAQDLSAYLDACRSKRNVAEYRQVGQVMKREVEALIEKVEGFREQVAAWVRANHGEFLPDGDSSALDE